MTASFLQNHPYLLGREMAGHAPPIRALSFLILSFYRGGSLCFITVQFARAIANKVVDGLKGFFCFVVLLTNRPDVICSYANFFMVKVSVWYRHQ